MENNIGKKIEVLRTWLGLSQTQFGEKIGVSVTSISFWEKGESIPKPENVARIENAFGVTMDMIQPPIPMEESAP